MAIPFLVNDTYRVALFVRYRDTQNQVNVFTYKVKTITGGASDEPALFSSLSTALGVAYKANVSSQQTYQGLKYNKIFPIPGSSNQTISGAGAGTLATDPIPPQCAPLISWRAATAPPKIRGRTYLPSLDEASSTTNGKLNAGAVTGCTAVANTLLAPGTLNCGTATTCTLELELLSGPLPGSIMYPITSFIVRSAFATQRRRSLINRPDLDNF